MGIINKLFVLSAPSGTGKNTLLKILLKEMDNIEESVSYTTRAPRSDETDGVEYFFVSKEEFEKRIQENDFLEYANVFGNYYGTSKSQVNGILAKNKHAILVIDTQGAMKVKQKFPAVLIFVLPPSLEELRRRLQERNTEDEQTIEKRLSWAKKEIEKKDAYDYVIINDQLKKAYQELKSIIIKEENS